MNETVIVGNISHPDVLSETSDDADDEHERRKKRSGIPAEHPSYVFFQIFCSPFVFRENKLKMKIKKNIFVTFVLN